jgi:hypothetical protein
MLWFGSKGAERDLFADESRGPGLALSRNSGGSRAANADGAPRKHAAFHSSEPADGKALPLVNSTRAGANTPLAEILLTRLRVPAARSARVCMIFSP